MLRTILHSSRVLATCPQHQRSFSTTLSRFSTDDTTSDDATTTTTTQDEEEPPMKLSRRRRRFHEWVKRDGSRFARPAEGTTNYLGRVPFPTNPLFQPRPPVSDTKREELYQLYQSDPEQWTIRQLAGIILQSQYTKGMEQYMGVNDQPANLLQEPLIDIFPNVSKPRFKVLEEDADFTAKDAADVLNRKEYTLLEKQAIASEEAKFKSVSPQADHQRGGKFLIVDTSA
ncbi:hypothetical protein BC941DRAFT_361007 [Chlamydoabsidia padenii]|nr:hypothetical protein BC941DRAFT_361007 [Chlamydoabsidia padenii]